MAEVFFVLTTIFVAYVVYVVVGDQMADIKSIASKAKVKSVPAETPAAAKATEIKAQVKEQKPAPKPAVKKETAAESKPAAPQPAVKGGLKDPETGEVTNLPSNYRFTKRWVKEALVKEGLLDKVYKNNELDDEANAKIKSALNELAKMDKYQA